MYRSFFIFIFIIISCSDESTFDPRQKRLQELDATCRKRNLILDDDYYRDLPLDSFPRKAVCRIKWNKSEMFQ